jgi:hypothetical protein
VFTEPLLRNGSLFIHLLLSNGCTPPFRGLCPAMGLYADVILVTDYIYIYTHTFLPQITVLASFRGPNRTSKEATKFCSVTEQGVKKRIAS